MPLYEIAALRSATQVIMTFVGAILLFVLTSCGQADLPITTSVSTAPAPTTSPTGSLSSPTPLPTRTYSPEDLAARATKEANLQAEQNRKATRAAISPAPMHTGAPSYSPQPTPILPYGISTFEECGGEESPVRGFLLWNCWHGLLNGIYSDVAAGAELVEPTPGELTLGGVYVVSPADGSVPRSPIYWTPVRTGRLEIIGVDGSRFSLRSSNGTMFVFDAIALQWVTPGPSPVPSLLPTP